MTTRFDLIQRVVVHLRQTFGSELPVFRTRAAALTVGLDDDPPDLALVVEMTTDTPSIPATSLCYQRSDLTLAVSVLSLSVNEDSSDAALRITERLDRELDGMLEVLRAAAPAPLVDELEDPGPLAANGVLVQRWEAADIRGLEREQAVGRAWTVFVEVTYQRPRGATP